MSRKEIKKALDQLDQEAQKIQELKKVERIREQKLSDIIKKRKQEREIEEALVNEEVERVHRRHDIILYASYVMAGLILGRYISHWPRRVWFDIFENLILLIGFTGVALAKRANGRRR